MTEPIVLKNTAPRVWRAARSRFENEEERQKHTEMIAQRRFLGLVEKNALLGDCALDDGIATLLCSSQ